MNPERILIGAEAVGIGRAALRKAAGYASLWTAFALLFGAVLAVAAAISARWEDDKIHFSWARRY